MESTSELESLKQNAIRMARHHRKTCAGAECNITLYGLFRLLELAGIALTKEERVEFF